MVTHTTWMCTLIIPKRCLIFPDYCSVLQYHQVVSKQVYTGFIDHLREPILVSPAKPKLSMRETALSNQTQFWVPVTCINELLNSILACCIWLGTEPKVCWEEARGRAARRAAEKMCRACTGVMCVCAPPSRRRLVCHLPCASALVPNDGGMQQANYPHSGASPQASATSLHQGPPSSRFALGPFQRHTHTQSQWQIIHILACLKVCHSTSLSSPL